MGVPKFFRFMNERYPCLSEVVKEYELPEFDNFYIDANGIIHNCSHPDDSVHFRITEEEIFKNIFHYLEMLFRLIQPKKLFFIAVDGVAPRAKMNQQRGRRFRTAKENEDAMKEAVKKGEKLPETDRFDSNCITPGTEFMEKLHRQLQYFIKKKISTESLWQKPKIILSGHNVPGEGEHKIMDYIRYLRSQSDWDPNTRHCLHGLDADLIMLGLCTHEPHFSLLREEVKFGKQQKRKTNVEETKFYLLHLSLMRDYLDLEFQSLKTKLPFPYDLENIIDDWVLMGFLVGNDFIPHLPHFHIANNALSMLYNAYMEVLPTLDGYINNHGNLNLERFEKYLGKLAEVDFENFKEQSADLRYFESKTGKKFPGTAGTSEFTIPELDLKSDEFDEELIALANDTDLMLADPYDSGESSDNEYREEFRMFKADFYKNKLEFDKVDSEVLMDQAECYIRAIQWNLFYYYVGCPSWSWYYPHHYSPYVSDINSFSSLDFKFGPSKPFLPFQQLLAVLPSASKKIVPAPFQDLMTSPESPIVNFYPTEFETDLNGKQHDWEAVVLLPFIDENSLISAMEPYYKELTEEEQLRNSIKPMEIYQYTKESLGRCEAPEYFSPISDNHAALTEIWSKDILLSPNQVVKGRLPGAVSGAFLGFPHLRGISYTSKLHAAKVKVFEHPSRGENMILKVEYNEISEEDEVDAIAHDLMGQIVFVGWPHIQRGKVTAVHSSKYQYKFDSGRIKKMNDEKDLGYGLNSEELRRQHYTILGIDLNKVDIVVYVKTVGDVRYLFEGNMAKLDYVWSKSTMPFPYQTTLKFVPLLDDGNLIGKERTVSDIFNDVKEVFILDPENNYGKFGLVKGVTGIGNVEVEIETNPELDLSGILELSASTDLKFYPGSVASQRLGMGSFLFSRVTGSILLQNIENQGKLNVGLCLKFTKQREELVGFTRKVKDGNMWLYSEKAIALLDSYMAKFPELFEYLGRHAENDIYFDKDVFPENSKEKILEIRQWLKEQPHTVAERRPFDAKLLTSEAIKEIEKRVVSSNLNKVLKCEKVFVHPSKLYIPTDKMGKAPPDPSIRTYLLDRVVSVRRNHNIPLGLKGTVVGFDKPNTCEDTLYDILFDEPVPGGRNLDCDEARLYRLPSQAFVNVTQGQRIFDRINRTPKKRMEFYSNNRDDNRIAFKAANNETQSIQNIGNIKVKQFFDGYKNSGKVSSPQDTRPVPNNDCRSEADSEFQAMWNKLISDTQPEEVPVHREVKAKPDEVLDPAVIEQTNALRKLLKLHDSSADNQQTKSVMELRPQMPFNQHDSSAESQQPKPLMELRPQVQFNQHVNINKTHPLNIRHPAKACGHVSCCSDLVQICASKNIAYPLFNYHRIQSSGEVLCTVIFPSPSDFGRVVGDASRSDEEAAENAACKAIRLIMQQDEKRRAFHLGLGNRLPYSVVRHSSPHTTNPNNRLPVTQTQSLGQLPSPPTKWCQSSAWPKQLMPNRRPQKGPSSPNQQQQVRQNCTTSSTEANPEERVSSGVTVERGGLADNPRRQLDQAPHQRPNRRPGGRPRPRIAANFTVPLNHNPHNAPP